MLRPIRTQRSGWLGSLARRRSSRPIAKRVIPLVSLVESTVVSGRVITSNEGNGATPRNRLGGGRRLLARCGATDSAGVSDAGVGSGMAISPRGKITARAGYTSTIGCEGAFWHFSQKVLVYKMWW